MKNTSLTAVRGVQVGHAQDEEARTGCTVVLGPFRAAAFVGGFASGTRELDVLGPTHLAPVIDAILLTGGSAFGLAAADGVMKWLEERGRGFDTGVVRVPLVPAAVIFDLGAANPARRPDSAMGYAACAAASDAPVREGRAGAGMGATVGKLLGPANAMAGGLGSWSSASGPYTIGALVVVNALGDVFSASGEVLAGARLPDGVFANSMKLLERGSSARGFADRQPNTTLAVVGTDAPLSRTELAALARQAANALARRIAPVFTQFDGDVVFALSTSANISEMPPADRLALGATAQLVLENAIERAVTQ
jgi:L-aminopeptidase/D-esterase-like protein